MDRAAQAAGAVLLSWLLTSAALAADVVDFSYLPVPPSLSGTPVSTLLQTLALGNPLRGSAGVRVSPNVVFDRRINPRCVFVGNTSTVRGVVQTIDVGRLAMYCN